jgi:hypothetical protein
MSVIQQKQQDTKDSFSSRHQASVPNLWTRESLKSLGTIWLVSLALIAYVFVFVKKSPPKQKRA